MAFFLVARRNTVRGATVERWRNGSFFPLSHSLLLDLFTLWLLGAFVTTTSSLGNHPEATPILASTSTFGRSPKHSLARRNTVRGATVQHIPFLYLLSLLYSSLSWGSEVFELNEVFFSSRNGAHCAA